MADGGDFDVKVRGADDLAALARRLRAAGRGDLRKELLKQIRTEATPIVRDLKQAVSTVPVKGTRGGGSKQRRTHRGGRAKAHGLRRSIASAIQVKITASGRTTGVRVRVNRLRLPEDQRSLPKALNRPGGWRHPVFGDRDVWAAQSGQEWWDPTIRPHAPKVRAGVAAVLARYADQLDS